MVQQPWKTVWQFLTKLNILLPYNAAFTLLWYWPKGTQNLYVHKNLHLDVFSSLIHYFKNLEAVRMPCNTWMDKLRLIQAMECYSALKRNELPSHGKTQREESRRAPNGSFLSVKDALSCNEHGGMHVSFQISIFHFLWINSQKNCWIIW